METESAVVDNRKEEEEDAPTKGIARTSTKTDKTKETIMEEKIVK